MGLKTSASAVGLLASCALVEWASAINVVSLNVERSATLAAGLRKRAIAKRDPFSVTIDNTGPLHGYIANITVGNPPQNLSIGVDTGSSDVWIPSSTACQCTGGTYDKTKSSTVDVVSTGDFNLTYLDANTVTGDYIKDDFTIGDIKIEGLQMGLGLSTTLSQAVMGLGYSSHVAAATKYPNLIDELVSQKKINTKAYSLYLNSVSDPSGVLLFGGIDNKKYTGSLSTLDILPTTQNPNTYVHPFIALQSMSLNFSSSNSTSIPIASTASDGSTVSVAGALLDSGATFAVFPSSIAQAIFKALGAVVSSSNSQIMYVDCDILTSSPDTTMNFEFGLPQSGSGPVIKVGIKELVYDLTSVFGAEGAAALSKENLPFKNTCVLGLDDSGDAGALILGDPFLRSAYVVYDLTNNQIRLGQTNFNSTESDIVEITADSSSTSSSSAGSGSSTTQSSTSSPTGATVVVTATGNSGTATSSGPASSSTSAGAAAVSAKPLDLTSLASLLILGIWSMMGGIWFIV